MANPLPETILQFGSGRFLRAFADLFVHHGNAAGHNVGRIVVVQSMSDDRAGGLNAQQGEYNVVVRGMEAGQVVDRVENCRSISRAVHAGSQWNDVLELARSPELKTILSNTTEAGYRLEENDRFDDAPPKSFPLKLLRVLHARWQANQPGLTIIPCELLEGNARLLCGIVLDQCRQAGLPPAFAEYVSRECVWLHTLVDRICTGTPKDHPILARDPMAIVAEPFAFWALEFDPRSRFSLAHPQLTYATNVEPYFLRKVRILNAAHTALLIKAVPRGFTIVRDAVNDPELGPWLERLLQEEIVPTLGDRVVNGKWFAEQTLDRFRNPFLDHKFADIALHHESKIDVRLVPTRDEYVAKFGQSPPLLSDVLADAKR
ncbi:MAG: altronate dehydrogenase [Gemmataceae bacterium]